MTPLLDFHQYVRVNKCPIPTINERVRQAAIDFCRDTEILTQTLAAINVVQGQETYTLSVAAPADYQPIRAVYLRYNGDQLFPLNKQEADIADPTWRAPEAGDPTFFLNVNPTTIQLNKQPQAAITSGLLVEVSVRPTETTSQLDDYLYTDWAEAIGFGALHRLYMMPNEVWTNTELAMYYEKKFADKIVEAKIHARKLNSSAELRVMPRRFV